MRSILDLLPFLSDINRKVLDEPVSEVVELILNRCERARCNDINIQMRQILNSRVVDSGTYISFSQNQRMNAIFFASARPDAPHVLLTKPESHQVTLPLPQCP